MFGIFKKIFGTRNERFIKRVKSKIQNIDALEPTYKVLSDEELVQTFQSFKVRVANGERLDDILPESFALVREASRRVLGMRHFTVQLIGGMALHQGKIAEMKTGEGKTLMATLPVTLNTLSGKGVHVVTVNDYLAQRDAEWMGKLYSFLGLSVGIIIHGLDDAQRKAAYGADITYGTNNEFGFDYLRDNMKFSAEQLVQRGHNFAIVDEVDSILIDEARTPLIISGQAEDSTELYVKVDSIIPALNPVEHFSVDEKTKTVTLTDEGTAKVEQMLNCGNLFDPANIAFLHHTVQALKAHVIFRRDVDYIVNDDQVVIVDEFTGRLMEGRRFSDGLHQALEAKERVKIAAENQTLATITYQNYFRLYNKLGGMTGTADTEAVEFQQIYGLEVLSIPTNMPMLRKDHPDRIYKTQKEKFLAIVDSIKEMHSTGQPILVGTISIETSELISQMLKQVGVPHNVLNAKYHEQEAEIIAEAGQAGKVTIATNMAGRGTDIVLGEGVREVGGLHILGTERHESRRIDNQLRGRSGRQGDAGSSRFFLALDDDLMRRFGGDRLAGMLERIGLEEGEPIEAGMISRSIENAQRRVEGYNFEIRKTLLDYDNVMNQQREVVYSLRKDAMFAENIETVIRDFIQDICYDIYGMSEAGHSIDAETANSMQAQLKDIFNISNKIELKEGVAPTFAETEKAVLSILEDLKNTSGDIYKEILRFFILEELDKAWKEHLLQMEFLREGIGLRGYGQRDPKQEYKREGFSLFQDMLDRMRENVLRILTHLRVEQRAPVEPVTDVIDVSVDTAQNAQAPTNAAHPFVHKGKTPKNLSYSGGDPSELQKNKQAVRNAKQPNRNDPCPCGSGKKYKKCCGINE